MNFKLPLMKRKGDKNDQNGPKGGPKNAQLNQESSQPKRDSISKDLKFIRNAVREFSNEKRANIGSIKSAIYVPIGNDVVGLKLYFFANYIFALKMQR